MRKGLLIVFYGPDNVGKSEQAKILTDKLNETGVNTKHIRYPIYNLAPTGPRLDGVLHKKTETLGEEDLQMLFAQNRRDFEPTLKSWLAAGVTTLSESYNGTGIVWGVLRGVPVERMEEINKGALEPDVCIFIDGPRRVDRLSNEPLYAKEEEEWYQARKMYLKMADRYGWIRIGGDAPILTVAGRIWAVVRPLVSMRGR